VTKMNVEHPTFNIQRRIIGRIPLSMFSVRCSMFDVRLFKIHCMFLLILMLAIFLSLFLIPQNGLAADDTDLEEVLEGFDDDAGSQADEALDDVLEGFDEDPSSADTVASAGAEGSNGQTTDRYPTFSIGGSARVRAFYNYAKDPPEQTETDWRGISSLRGDLLVEAESKLNASWQAKVSLWGYYDLIYDVRGYDEYTDEVIETHVKDLELRDTYIQGSLLPSLDIKVGRQIVVWGKSDNLRVCDVLNPLYLREVGMTDIRDLRLPVTMARLDFYWSYWNVSAMAIPEIRFNDLPVYGGDYYFEDASFPDEEVPEDGIDNMEYALALNGTFSGWDLSFYYADIYDDAPYLYLESLDLADPGPPPVYQPNLVLKHARLSMFGAAWNLALGNWLLKAETAHFQGLEFYNTPDETYSRTDVLAGIEYSGFREITIGIEALNRHLHDYDDVLEDPPAGVKQNEPQYAARLTKDWLHETLTLTLLASAFGVDFLAGSYERIALEYDLTDNFIVNGGLVLYQSGDRPGFENIGDSDRIFLEFKYSF